jgi:D-alanyl-D-alanine carboxypeptidase
LSLKRLFYILLLFSLVVIGATVQAQESDLAGELQHLLEDYVAPTDPAVVLLVNSPQLGTWIGAAGLADIDAGVPVQAGDRFRIGSITKTFVATIVLQLADEEVLSLDNLMSQWLPAEIIENLPYGDEITLRQLLNMTSGIFSYTDSDAFNEAVDSAPTHRWTAAETVEYVYDEEPYFPPGEGYYYSNTNYNLLHLIIEAATGSTLADALQTRIFAPLDMGETYLESGSELAKGIVRGYSAADDGLQDVTDINEGVGLGDGGIISTAADLARFPRALLRGDLLSEAALDEMLAMVDDDEGGHYGLGIVFSESEWGAVYGHTGATAGFQSEMWYFPDQDVAIVALTNYFDSEILSALVQDAMSIALPHE